MYNLLVNERERYPKNEKGIKTMFENLHYATTTAKVEQDINDIFLYQNFIRYIRNKSCGVSNKQAQKELAEIYNFSKVDFYRMLGKAQERGHAVICNKPRLGLKFNIRPTAEGIVVNVHDFCSLMGVKA